MSTYTSLHSIQKPTESTRDFLASNKPIYNRKNTRITPSDASLRKLDIEGTQKKGFRVYRADRYIKEQDNSFVVAIKKVACGTANFFRRLVGQAVHVKMGGESITVNKKSFSKYLVRQISAKNTPQSGEKNAPVYNTAYKVAYSAFKKKITLNAQTLTHKATKNIYLIAQDNLEAIQALKKRVGNVDTKSGVFKPEAQERIYQLKQKISLICDKLTNQFVKLQNINIDFLQSSNTMRMKISAIKPVLISAEKASNKMKDKNLGQHSSHIYNNDDLDSLDRFSTSDQVKSYNAKIEKLEKSIEDLEKVLNTPVNNSPIA